MNELPLRRPALGTAALVLASVLLGAGCDAGADPGDEPEAAPVPVTVTAVRARTMTLRPELVLVGHFVARPESVARVSARVSGTVAAVDVIEGGELGEGDTLLRLDPTLFHAEVESARALVAEREAVLSRLVQGARPEELDVARANLRRDEAVARSAAVALGALEGLAARDELSGVRLQEARTAVETADAGVAATEAALRLLEAGTLPARLREAEASLASARAGLDAAEARLSFTIVAAPIAGTLSRVDVRTGQGVDPGTSLAEVADLTRLLLRVRVPAAVVSALDPGVPCRVTSDVLAAPLEGKVDRFGPGADEATGGVWAYVAVDNPGPLRPGASGTVALRLAPIEGCTAIPVAAATERAGTPVVVLIEDGRAREVEVRTGARSDGWVEVVEGLQPGDQVATVGGYGLPDGQPVKLAAAGEAP